MSIGDKISNKSEELQGKGKEGVGEATDGKDLKAEGKGDEAKGNLKAGQGRRSGTCSIPDRHRRRPAPCTLRGGPRPSPGQYAESVRRSRAGG